MEWVNFGIGENEATTTPGLVEALTQMLTQPTGILGLTIYISVVSLVSSACGHQKEGIGIPTLIFFPMVSGICHIPANKLKVQPLKTYYGIHGFGVTDFQHSR